MKFKSFYILTLLLGLITTLNSQNKVDKLAGLRTAKKIVSVSVLPQQPDYAIQIIALKYPAGEPGFFKNVNEAREFSCADGFVRYCVGSFESFDAAKAELVYYKDLGYVQSFVVNTQNYVLEGGKMRGNFKPDPNKSYTIQLSAFRFPVYLSHFKGVENVMEFYLDDKIYRYTIGKYSYENALQELASIKSLGFKDAYVTELDAYLPYQIE